MAEAISEETFLASPWKALVDEVVWVAAVVFAAVGAYKSPLFSIFSPNFISTSLFCSFNY
jgi:hypothetical protein